VRRLLPIVLIAAGLLACSDPAPDPQPPDAAGPGPVERTASLSDLQGEVRVKRAGAPEWQAASEGMLLAIDDKVRTQRNSFATIRFEEGGVMRLEPESLVAVTDLTVERRDQVRRSTFTLMEGRVEAELDSLTKEGSEFKIKTPTAQTSVVRREVAFQ
jgi:hypothetical protein